MDSYEGDLSNGLRTYYNANTGVTSTFYDGQVRRGTSIKVSQKTTGWHSLSKAQKKAAPWHPFFQEVQRMRMSTRKFVSYTVGSGNVKKQWVKTGYCLNLSNLGTGNGTVSRISDSWFTPLELEARRRALAKTQGRVANFSVGLAQAMAERKQIAGLMEQTMKRLVSFALLLRRGKFDELYKKYGIPKPVRTKSGDWVVPKYRRVQRTYSSAFDEKGNPLSKPKKIRTVAYREVHTKRWLQFDNLWLEFQYGWRPFVNDIYDSCEAIANAHYKRQPLRFSAAEEMSETISRPGPTISEGGAAQFPTLVKANVKVKVRYVLECSEDNTLMTTLSNTGLTNPAALAWELLPYSFVIDWFVPVGNYLKQLEYARGLTFKQACHVTNVLVDGQRLVLPNVGATSTSYPWPGEASGSPDNLRFRLKRRSILGSFPYQKLPSFRPNLGIERSLSGIALLSQLIRGNHDTKKVMRYL